MAKNISRYDYNGTLGWLARIYKSGKERSKLFTDKKYGGKAKAQKAAIKYRDLQNQKLSEIGQSPGFVANSSRNTSGVIGVSRVIKEERNGKEFAYWQASWRKDGKTITRSFSVNKHGEESAKRKAIQVRHNAMVMKHGDQYIAERKKNPQLPNDNQLT